MCLTRGPQRPSRCLEKTCQNNFSTSKNNFSTWQNNFHTCKNNFPTCKNNFPTCKNYFPTCLINFPTNKWIQKKTYRNNLSWHAYILAYLLRKFWQKWSIFGHFLGWVAQSELQPCMTMAFRFAGLDTPHAYFGPCLPILAYFLAPQPMLSYIIFLWSVLGSFELIQDWPWLAVQFIPVGRWVGSKNSILLWWNFFDGCPSQNCYKSINRSWTSILGQIGGYIFSENGHMCIAYFGHFCPIFAIYV